MKFSERKITSLQFFRQLTERWLRNEVRRVNELEKKEKYTKMNKNFLPISIDIANEKILIIGGGHDALKKIRILQRFDAHIEVLALNVCKEIKGIGIKCIETEYDKRFLKGYLMVYSCANNDELDRQIVKDAKEAGVLVNIHDKPALCQFVSPAIYRKGKITVAVGSNGEDVYESIRIRNLIKEKINFN